MSRHSVALESSQQAAASAGRPPGPAAGSSGVVAQQCARGAAAPEVEFAIALRTARVIQPLDERTPVRRRGNAAGRGAGARPRCVLRFDRGHAQPPGGRRHDLARSEEHTSELQSLMRISYAVFCLKKKNKKNTKQHRVQSYNINHTYKTT